MVIKNGQKKVHQYWNLEFNINHSCTAEYCKERIEELLENQ